MIPVSTVGDSPPEFFVSIAIMLGLIFLAHTVVPLWDWYRKKKQKEQEK